MSFFGDNEVGSVGNICVEAAEGYSGTIGAQMLMVEGFQNDMDMFVESLKSDRKEYAMVREGAGDSEITTMQEGALGSFWNKIKEFVKRIIAKIKGMFNGFIAKFQAWMGKDGKAFFDKYKKEIFSGKNLDGLKVKYSKPTGVDSIMVNITDAQPGANIPEGKTHSDLVDEYLGKITLPDVKSASKGSFRKDFHEACFETEEAGYELKSGSIAEYVKFISGKENLIETVKKMATAQEKGLNTYIRQIEKFQGKTTDYAVDSSKNTHDGYGGDFNGKDPKNPVVGGKFTGKAEGHQKVAASLQKEASAMQEALGIANSAALTEIKFAVAQSRRIAAAIVAFNPKKNEDTSLLEIEQEAAEYEILSALEAVN